MEWPARLPPVGGGGVSTEVLIRSAGAVIRSTKILIRSVGALTGVPKY